MNKLVILVFSLTMLCAQGLSAQEQPDRSARVDDATLTARVKAALVQDESTKARQIDVETKDGVVQLSGFVDSEETASAALTTAKSVPGVQEVRNDLAVRESERKVGQGASDTIIAAKVKMQLAREGDLAADSDVNVEVDDGVVQLSGFVSSIAEKTRAADVASTVDGVRDVRNNIALER